MLIFYYGKAQARYSYYSTLKGASSLCELI